MKDVKRPRVYADTSLYGGCFDIEFEEESRAFFRDVAAGRFLLVFAELTVRELDLVPEHVRRVLQDLPGEAVEFVPFSPEIGHLRDAYIAAGVLNAASQADAEHVAAATVAGVDLMVSWNFKHIVHFDKIAGFEAVNLLQGYKPVRIYSPREVVET